MSNRSSALAFLVAILFWALPAFAQDDPTTVFILPPHSDDAELARALSDELGAFREALTSTGRFRIAADREMESVVSECRTQINAAPSDERECQLQAARVAAMDHVLELIGREVGGQWEIVLRVIDGRDPNELFVTSEMVSGGRGADVAGGLARLARSYTRWASGGGEELVCYEAVLAPEPPIANASVGAVLEVLDVSPERVSIRVNGRSIGISPGQFFGLEAGPTTVELSADGFGANEREVTLTEGEVVTVRGVTLGELPGRIVITSNVVGVTASVDSREVGRVMTEPLDVEVEPGRHEVIVSRDGYTTYTESVEVLAGGSSEVTALVEVTRCGDGRIEEGEECDDGNVVGGDGCSSNCRQESRCGDGSLDAHEECDDWNTRNGDGCSSSCQIEFDCGDGRRALGEECDDGNLRNGDGCNSRCRREQMPQRR